MPRISIERSFFLEETRESEKEIKSADVCVSVGHEKNNNDHDDEDGEREREQVRGNKVIFTC